MVTYSKTPTKNNTDLADINELLVGLFLNNGKWFDSAAKSQHDSKQKKLTEFQYVDQKEKASVMATGFVQWAKANGYSGIVKKVFWTARPNVITRIVGYNVDQRKNPTDILIEFTRGPANGFIGMSAKSTNTNRDITFKNLGIGTIEKKLKIKLSDIVDNATGVLIRKFKLSKTGSARTNEIRRSPEIKKFANKLGSESLMAMRNRTLVKMNTMTQDQLYNYIVEDWMDASKIMSPYIKVTGMGKAPPYKAKVEDPLKNDKMSNMSKGVIKMMRVGNDSIGIKAKGKRVMKIRFKFQNEKLASSAVALGEPW